MSNAVWKTQSSVYNYLRSNPISRRLLSSENDGIESLLRSIESEKIAKALDMGTGRGNGLKLMPNFTSFIAGIDDCLNMVEKTKPFFPEAEFVNADAQSLPFKDGCFDLILCIGLSEYIADMRSLLNGICRTLRENGYLILTASPKNLMTALRLVLGHRLYPRNRDIVRDAIENSGFHIMAENKSISQIQFLARKR
jgi:ubiquinone/menaquinone biosynthesis C-methylase UbiE